MSVQPPSRYTLPYFIHYFTCLLLYSDIKNNHLGVCLSAHRGKRLLFWFSWIEEAAVLAFTYKATQEKCHPLVLNKVAVSSKSVNEDKLMCQYFCSIVLRMQSQNHKGWKSPSRYLVQSSPYHHSHPLNHVPKYQLSGNFSSYQMQIL